MRKKEGELWTLDEISKEVAKSHVFSVNPKMNYCGIVDSDDRWYRLWKKKEDKWEEIDVKAMAQIIAEYLSKYVSVKRLLEDKILHKPLDTILQLEKRVKCEGEVKEHKGCYYLKIKGERGPALELDL